MADRVELGDQVRDPITGFKGTAIARTSWLHGCVRILVQPKGNKEGTKVEEAQNFDEPQLEVTKRARLAEAVPRHGGRDDHAILRKEPTRR